MSNNPESPKIMNQFQGIDQSVDKDPAHYWGVSENGTKTHISEQNLLAEYGYTPENVADGLNDSASVTPEATTPAVEATSTTENQEAPAEIDPWTRLRDAEEAFKNKPHTLTNTELVKARKAVTRAEAQTKLDANKWESRMTTHMAGKDTVDKRENDPFSNLSDQEITTQNQRDLQSDLATKHGLDTISEDDERYYTTMEEAKKAAKEADVAPDTPVRPIEPTGPSAPPKASESDAYNWANDGADDASGEKQLSPEELENEALRANLKEACDQYIQAKSEGNKDISLFALHLIKKNFNELAKRHNWSKEKEDKYKQVIKDYLKNDGKKKVAVADAVSGDQVVAADASVVEAPNRTKRERLRDRWTALMVGDVRGAVGRNPEKESKKRKWLLIGAAALAGAGLVAWAKQKGVDVIPFLDGDGLDLNPLNNGDAASDGKGKGGKTGPTAVPEGGTTTPTGNPDAVQDIFRDVNNGPVTTPNGELVDTL